MSCLMCGDWACKKHVGYKGQRYEVRYTDSEGKDCLFGWTNDAEGGVFVTSIEMHPGWSNPRVVDLRPKEPKP